MFYSTRRNVDLSPNAKFRTIVRINAIRYLCCTTSRMLTKLNKIDKNLVPWMSQISFFFSLVVKYSQRATNAYNTYFIHKTILVHDKIAQIHTNTQRKVIVTSYTPAEWYKTARLCNGTICCTFSSHRLVHNKLTRCCTTHNITFVYRWVPGRTTWMHMSFCRELIFLPVHGVGATFVIYQNWESVPQFMPRKIQSDLGYPATSGPSPIRISDLAGYGSCAETQQVQ